MKLGQEDLLGYSVTRRMRTNDLEFALASRRDSVTDSRAVIGSKKRRELIEHNTFKSF